MFGKEERPNYNGEYLRSLTNGLLGDLTLKQTLTNVVIPVEIIAQDEYLVLDKMLQNDLLFPEYSLLMLCSALLSAAVNGVLLALVPVESSSDFAESWPALVLSLTIPTFDIKFLQPVIFSTTDAKLNDLKNARLADVCIGTSAAPTFLPAHYFETKDAEGNSCDFNLIDGGVAANNPTMMAIRQIWKEIPMQNTDDDRIKPLEHSKRMLVLSLATGAAKHTQKYSAAAASKWGLRDWLYDNGATPLLDVYGDASSDMVDFHVSTLFQALDCKNNYLRIQDDKLTGEESTVDIATSENLQRLVEIGKELLKKTVSRVNLDTGNFEEIKGGSSNEEALAYFAELLVEEKKFRQNQ